jgi:pimeloyl-ACP methyl ester carboxylesterase
LPYIRTHEIALHYRVVGHGPQPLVLLHGWAGAWGHWRELLARLPVDVFTAYAFDMRGFGASAKPDQGYAAHDLARDILAAIKGLALQNVILVGSSLGGCIALSAYALDCAPVRAMVLLDSSPGWLAPGLPEAYMGNVDRLVRLVEGINLNPDRLAVMVRNSFYRSVPQERVDELVSDAFFALPAALTQTIQGSFVNYASVLPGVTCPTLVVRGAEDRTWGAGSAILAQIPGSQYVILEACGHFPMIEAPDRFMALLNEFCAQQVGISSRQPTRADDTREAL